MTRVNVKICGITNLEDAIVASKAGADYLGFILYDKSSRYVSPESVAAILTGLRAANYDTPGIGVFVNEAISEIAAILDRTGLAFAQLHGDESVDNVAALEGRGFKAVRPKSSDDLSAYPEYTQSAPVEGPQLLVDAYSPTAYGGTGHQAEWTAAQQITDSVPRLLLAGGLTPENVVEAINQVQPWGVDVSSGVETQPGQKDHDKVRAFVAAATAIGRANNSRSDSG